MLEPPQFHAAVSPGFMSLLLLMIAAVDLLFKGVRTIEKPDLCKISALTPQRAVTTLGNQAIVTGCDRCSTIAQEGFWTRSTSRCWHIRTIMSCSKRRLLGKLAIEPVADRGS